MRWNLTNIVAGAAAVVRCNPFSWRQPTTYDVHRMSEAILERAEQERVPVVIARQRFIRERMLGMFGVTVLSCLAMLLTLFGVLQEWPESLVLGMALVPMALFLGTDWADRRLQKRQAKAAPPSDNVIPLRPQKAEQTQAGTRAS